MYNVCALRYYQKRELCKTVLSADLFDLRLVTESSRNYPNLSCQNMSVDFSPISKESGHGKVSAYKCPYAYKVDITFNEGLMSHKNTLVPIKIYISGSIYKNSVVLYYQHVTPLHKRIKAYSVAFNVPAKSLSHMVWQQRNMIWERSIEPIKPFRERWVHRPRAKDGNLIRDQAEAEAALGRSEAVKRLPCK